MFDTLLESSNQDNSNKLSGIGFGEEISKWCRLKLILSILSGTYKLPPNLQSAANQVLYSPLGTLFQASISREFTLQVIQ